MAAVHQEQASAAQAKSAAAQGPAGGASPGIHGWTVCGWDVGGRAHVNREQVPTGDLNPAHPSVQQQHGHETFGYGFPLSYPSGIPQGFRRSWANKHPGPLQHQSSSSTRGRDGMRPPGYDSKMGPPGFPAAPQSNGWVLRHQAVPLPQSSMMMA
ncbi:TPA: hypothetical protein ACH3X3_010259 [Trebouxia sp. C0006]